MSSPKPDPPIPESSPGSNSPPPSARDENGKSRPDDGPDVEAVGPDRTVQGLPVQLYDTKRPKHFLSGFSSGATNIAKGVGAGATAVVVGTTVGAKKKGVLGGFAGFLGGALVGAGCVVGGVVTGTQQIVNGIIRTPSCLMKGAGNEEMWDEVAHRWVRFDLDAEREKLPANDDDIFGPYKQQVDDPNERPQQTMSSDECCKELGIEPSQASEAGTVRKAYLKLALKTHPDKNPNDPSSANRFRRINEAHDTLMKKLQANAHHPSAGGDTGHVLASENPIEQALGTRLFEPFIGRQQFLLYIAHLQFCQASLPHSVLEQFARRRSIRVAVHLSRMLDSLGEDPHLLQPVVASLVDTPLGPEILHLIAERYVLVGKSFLGATNFAEIVSAAANRFREQADSRVCFVRNLFGKDVLNTLFSICRSDIVYTVDWSARMVVHDASIDSEARRRRAAQLIEVGNFFMETAARAKSARPPPTPPPQQPAPPQSQPEQPSTK